jgi:hypothetical protein
MADRPVIYTGLDLGAAKDYTALACVQRWPADPVPAAVGSDRPPRRPWRYAVRHLQTWPLGVRYTTVADDVRRLYDDPRLTGSALVPDYTGVGRPVVDALRASRVRARLVPVLTTGGKLVHQNAEAGVWNVPKADLVARLQVLLQAGLVQVEQRLPLAARLRKELEGFRVTITKAKNETYAADASQHDDLLFAVMLAVWLGERDGGGLASGITVGGGGVVDDAPPGVFATAG